MLIFLLGWLVNFIFVVICFLMLRNIQMMCACLMSRASYRAALFNGRGDVPDIPFIQRSIEGAWTSGFDPIGSEQMGSILYGTDKWIGKI